MTLPTEAYKIVDYYRPAVDDRTRAETLDTEFPYYAQTLGLQAVTLIDLSDNLSGTFKWRGAFVGASQLKEQGVDHMIVPSAGNHARGAVLAAKVLDMDVTIAVPASAPPAKRQHLRDLWDSHQLRVVTAGTTFDESLAWALAQEGDLLHPYDDPAVISGQGTAADDILSSVPDVQHIVTPIGGGGLAAGIQQRLVELGRDDITIHLAEAEGSNGLRKSIREGVLTDADAPNVRFGGSCVKRAGHNAFELFRTQPNLSIIQVPESDVDELSYWYDLSRHELMRTTLPNFEPTSLVAVAALKQLRHLEGQTVVLGTGKNDTIYPSKQTRGYRVPV